MDDRSLVLRYYAFRGTSSVGFVTPIFTLFMLARGLSYTEITTLSAVVAAVVTAGEVPTGYVGDRIGRRDSLVASTLLLVASLVGFLWARTYPAFVGLYVLWALGLALASGSASAWLYDALRERDADDEFTRVRGRGESVRRAAGVVAMVAGGLLYAVEPTYPFVAAAGLNALGVPVLLSLPRNEGYADGSGDRLSLVEAAGVVRTALRRPDLRTFVGFVGLFFGAVSASNTYVQPVTVDVLTGRVAALGVPAPATLGVLYAGFTGVAAVGSYHAATLESRFGVRRTVAVVAVGAAVALLVPLLVPLVAVPAFLAMRAGDATLRPVANRYLNDRIDAAGRATVLSAASMAYALVRIPLLLASGVVADAAGPLVAVAGVAGTFLAGAALLSLLGVPVGREATDAARR